jgi:hypothetical protein
MSTNQGSFLPADRAVFEATLKSNAGSWQASYLVNDDTSDFDSAEGETRSFDTRHEARIWLAAAAERRGFEQYDVKEGAWLV